MARRGSKAAANEARTQQERARVYQARARWNDDQRRRRVRDNTIASVVGGLVVVLCFVSQGVHASVTAPGGPLGPVPGPTVTVPTPVPEESETPGEEETPAPDDADVAGADDATAPEEGDAPEEEPSDEETPAP